MLSTITVGRLLLSSSHKALGQRTVNLALNNNARFVNSTGISFGSRLNNLQSARSFGKTNALPARFGRSAPERAVPINTTPQNVGTMHDYGMLTLSLAGVAGIGTLCYYGSGMSNVEGTLERSLLWPQYVKDRIQSTYAHLGGGFAISAAAAYGVFKSPALMKLASQGGILAAIGTFAALIASSTIVHNIPYEPGFGPKQLAWVGHCSLLGGILAPLSMFGGPAIIRAAFYTAGVVGGLSAIAVCAPSEKFLVNTAPLSIGLGLVVASSLGSMLLPPTSRFGLGLYGISLYGGLLLFSGMLLYDTQKTIKRAELHPSYMMSPYDPINNSLNIYMDILNIFIRMLAIFGGGGQRRK